LAQARAKFQEREAASQRELALQKRAMSRMTFEQFLARCQRNDWAAVIEGEMQND